MSAAYILELDELAGISKRLAKTARDSIRFQATLADDAKIKIGASKIGGAPDLPKGTAWPTAKLPLPRKHGPILGGINRDLAIGADGTIALPFIAQIALADVARHKTQLPKSGLLSFFYDNLAYAEPVAKNWDVFDPAANVGYRYVAWGHPARWRVIHSTTKPLVRLSVPDAVHAETRYPPAKLTKPTREQTLPNFESAWFLDPYGKSMHDRKRQIALDDEQREAYNEAIYDERANRVTHMMLGHADYMQPYALENPYLRWHDTLFPDERKLNKKAPPIADFQASQLLLQISSDSFGRGGHLYFFIRNADLAAGNFSRVWATEQ